MSSGLAARMLTAELGESDAIWLRRLHNWRRPQRRSAIPWHQTTDGGPAYYFDDVRAFIDMQLLTRAPLEQGGSTAIHTKASATPDVDANRAFVRVFWNAHAAQGCFNITPSVARTLAEALVKAADSAVAIAEDRLLGADA